MELLDVYNQTSAIKVHLESSAIESSWLKDSQYGEVDSLHCTGREILYDFHRVGECTQLHDNEECMLNV